MPSARDEVLLLAARQCGWVTARQAHLRGAGSDVLRRMTRAGVLVNEKGLYRLAGPAGDRESATWAAVLRTGGVLSHRSAAVRHGAKIANPEIEVVIIASRRLAPIDGVVVHRTRRLDSDQGVQNASRLPVTSPPRTFVDLASPRSNVSDGDLLRCLDDWTAAGPVTSSWLRWFVTDEAHHLPGRRRALALLEDPSSAPSDSGAERELARILSRGGLAPFERQHRIRTSGGAVAWVDFAWPGEQVALELDGYRYHSAPAAFVADRNRGNEIELAGWLLLRTTPRAMRDDPAKIVSAVERARRLRRLRGDA